MIESRKLPAGIFGICDDIVATMHSIQDGVDAKFIQKLDNIHGSHQHYHGRGNLFTIKHYAGDVDYSINGFCEKNRDQLYDSLIELMKSSSE